MLGSTLQYIYRFILFFRPPMKTMQRPSISLRPSKQAGRPSSLPNDLYDVVIIAHDQAKCAAKGQQQQQPHSLRWQSRICYSERVWAQTAAASELCAHKKIMEDFPITPNDWENIQGPISLFFLFPLRSSFPWKENNIENKATLKVSTVLFHASYFSFSLSSPKKKGQSQFAVSLFP